MTTLCEHWADVHFDVAAVGSRPVSSEASVRQSAADGPDAPDTLAAELILRVYDPSVVSFVGAIAKAHHEVATPGGSPRL